MDLKVASLAVISLLVVLQLTNCQEDPWSQVASVIIGKIGSLYKNGEFEINGHRCYYQSKPSFAKFKLTYKGKVWCPGWTDVTGNSRTKSQSGAMQHAVRDFMNKVRDRGLISAEDAQKYIDQRG